MNKLCLKDLSLSGKRVLMRVDFNVPINSEGEILDDARIKASLPSIRYILDHGASLVLMTHLGRPKGFDLKLSLLPVAKRLSDFLGFEVRLAPDSVGEETTQMAESLKPGEVLLLENLRFHEEEEEPEKDLQFVKNLARLGNVFVNDAFGTAHRAHSSTSLIAKYFPEKAAAGFLMEKEILALSNLLDSPERPFYAVLGGAKVSTKIGVIHHLLETVDTLFIGGAMAFTFLKAKGYQIGDSLYEESEIQTALDVFKRESKFQLPLDLVVAKEIKEGAEFKVVSVKEGFSSPWKGVDIGPKTIEAWSQKLQEAHSVFWNGPLGVFEIEEFSKGTFEIARALAKSKAHVTVGGGDSLSAIYKSGLANQFSHLSTGGGASLEFLEYGHLPGIDALSNK